MKQVASYWWEFTQRVSVDNTIDDTVSAIFREILGRCQHEAFDEGMRLGAGLPAFPLKDTVAETRKIDPDWPEYRILDEWWRKHSLALKIHVARKRLEAEQKVAVLEKRLMEVPSSITVEMNSEAAK